MPKTIHLFRHGLTEWNQLRRMQGHTDIPLNPEGQQQALALQEYFAQNPVDLFMSSDLQRAKETAAIANRNLRRPLHTNSGLRETNLGQLEGLTLPEAQEKFGVQTWENWLSLDSKYFDFAFPDGESTHQALARFTTTLKSFCKDYEFQSAGVCTHGLILRRFLHSLKPELTEALPIPNCVIYTVTWSHEQQKFFFSL